MRPILCIELLKTFSPIELESLEKILSCEYFNTDNWIEKLLKKLRKHVLKEGVFDNEVQCIVYREVFDHLPMPKDVLKKNERDWLNKNLNKLMRMAELFLSIQNLKKSNEHKCDLLYPELLKRKQYQSFQQHIKKSNAALDRQVKGGAYYIQKYKTETIIFKYLHQSGRLSKEDNLQNLIQNLDMYYALEKLGLERTALSMKYLSRESEYDLSSMDATVPLLNLPKYANHPLITFYRANITLMKTESEIAYYDLLNLLSESESAVPVDALKGFYTTLTNYCTRQIKNGKSEYEKKMFDLYKTMDEKKLLIDKNLNIIKFKNIFTVSCRVGEYEWAKDVFERYSQYIKHEIKGKVVLFNEGTLAFYQKDYDTAHKYFAELNQAHNKINNVYDINVRTLILKCLYEKGQYSSSTMQYFRSAKTFFKKNKSLSEKDKIGYPNFVEILINLYRIRHNEGKRALAWLKIKLNNQETNSDKGWLLEKIEELKNKIK